mgnify:CR=1 FL=1
MLFRSYEDLHQDTPGQLRRLVAFLGLGGVSDAAIAAAVEFASFSNMRQRETAAAGAAPNRLDGGKAEDPESLKTRKGKVGGYVAYMSPEQAAWTTRRLEAELDPWYGYPYEPGRAAPGTI